jgi:RNA polymerase sigma-54 factor
MALTPRLDQRQTQTLVMTPQLQQAIKLLQLSNLELADFVEQALEQNPLLEREDGTRDGAEGEAMAQVEGDQRVDDESLAPVDIATGGGQELVADAGLDVDYDNVWNNDSSTDTPAGGLSLPAFSSIGGGGDAGFDDSLPGIEETLSETVSLRDHLIGQLNIELADPIDRIIGLHLIDTLDEAGYVTGDIGLIAGTLSCSPARVEEVLLILQGFDPPGIFARNLAECLALQLKERDRLDPAMRALLDNLGLLAKRDFAGLMRACGVDAEDITDMVAEIRTLNPKPALAFDHAVAQPIAPDILMRSQPGGGWVVELNNDTLPRVLVNNHYYARISRAARSKTERQYITEQFHSANWLVKSLHQRATTILKVATEIVRQQEMFFMKGVSFLKPLVLRDIAAAIEMHESTISRVTSNKYIATPRGIYELKYFFTTAIGSSSGGDAHSAEAVRHRIKTLVDAEASDGILSDDKIVEILNAEGIAIARRTVAKYREGMRIASSVQRRREKAQVP